jgi:hypothetical protein
VGLLTNTREGRTKSRPRFCCGFACVERPVILAATRRGKSGERN